MLAKKLKTYLDKNHVDYQTIEHPASYTAMQIAESAHIPGHQLAKAVILKIDGKFAMMVLPADSQINFRNLEKQLNTDNIRLASEYEFQDKFPDCEVGAMPALGNIYEIPVYISDELNDLKNNDIAFNAGNHRELIKMPYDDFEKLAKPEHVH